MMVDSASLHIPGYRIVRLLGQGGMAAVYLAIQESFEREVALKVLSPATTSDDSFTERFIREAKIVSRLVHPHIVTVYDVGVIDDHYYLSMEYVPGQDLKQGRHQLDLKQRLQAVKDIALALDFAGKKGYVHRDVKPENIMLHGEDGRALLMDFGIARPTEVSMGMTQTGTAIGTPHYMSPEQARGKAVDGRADLYSLGVVLYLLLTGEVPFDADSAVAIGIKHVSEPIPRLPEELMVFQPIINTCLSKDPAHRYQNGNELITALDAMDEANLQTAEATIKARVDHYQPAVDTHATTMPSPAMVTTEQNTLETAAVTRVVGGRGTSSATLAITADLEDRVDTIIESPSTPLWSWLAAAGVAASVIATVVYHQKLPEGSQLVIDTMNQEVIEKPLAQAPASDSVSESPDISQVASPESDTATVEVAGKGFQVEDPKLIALQQDSKVSLKPTPAPPVKVVTLEEQLLELSKQQKRLREEPALVPSLTLELANRYRQLLGRYPNNAKVRQGLTALRNFFTQEVTEAIAQKDIVRAEMLLESATDAFPRLTQDTRFQRWRDRLQSAQEFQQSINEAQSALASDKLQEAASALARARKMDPDSAQVRKASQRLSAHYAQLAGRWLVQGQWQKAATAVEQGKALSPKNKKLKSLSAQVNKLRQLDKAVSLAKQYQTSGQLLAPPGKNAVAQYRQVLSMQANHPIALQELELIESQQISAAEAALNAGALSQAEQLTRAALDAFPQSTRLLDLQASVDISLATALAKTQPRVSKILVSNSSLTSIVDQAQPSLQVDRVIHVGFQFENFATDSSVVQAILFDGARSLQIAQVPVIISGNDGVHFFRIERPVEGFGDGGYSIDLVLGDKRLTSTTFEVKNNSGF